jgi:predicted dehydrogenase
MALTALIVGLGSIGRRHARNWSTLGLGPVWVCRQTDNPQPETVDVQRTFTDLAEALAAGPDVVFVTNPTHLHVVTALAAVRAGCHILVEKPLGASLDGVVELLREAHDRGRHVMVGYDFRFHPGLARMRDLLQQGAIGRPLSSRAEMGEYLPGWHPWEDYRQSYAARREMGGGPVLTLSHELDSVCWLLGQPTEVLCATANTGALEIDTEEVAEILLRFPDDVLASVHVDYLRRPPQRTIEVTGSEGILRWEYEANRLLVYAPGTREWRIEQGRPTFDRNDMFLDQTRAVAARIRGANQSPLPTGDEGAALLRVALAALQSAREGRTVELSDSPDDAPVSLTPSPTAL